MNMGNGKKRVMTKWQAALASGIVACVIYVGALNNQWALDDEPIIANNPNVHSTAAARSAFFSPYWPLSEGHLAGQYRPLTILSYGVDWSVSGGSPKWFHAVNILLHGLATLLFVLLLSPWLSALGGLVAGVVFAIHPVHVEAVANVVGRAELLVAISLFGMLLAARRFRRARGAGARTAWLGLTLALILTGLLSKEHAVVAVAFLLLDEVLSRGDVRRSAAVYMGAVAVTGAWLVLWRGIAGRYVELSEAVTLAGLGVGERLATALPVQLHTVRLLVWPLDLVSDYNPQTIVQQTSLSFGAVIGAMLVGTIAALGFLLGRKIPAIAFGIFMGVIAYAPTSNLIFASGVIFAERNLYIGAGATAVVAAWLVTGPSQPGFRRMALVALFGWCVLFSVRTVQRIPHWHDTPSLVIEDLAEHSENYRTRLRLASFYEVSGRTANAFAETVAAGAIFPNDPLLPVRSVPLALALSFPRVATTEAERSYALASDSPDAVKLLVETYLAVGRNAAALRVAREGLERLTHNRFIEASYSSVADSLGFPTWQRQLAQARLAWVDGRLGAARRALAAAEVELPPRPDDGRPCWDVDRALPLAHRLSPAFAPRLEQLLRAAECRSEPGSRKSDIGR